MLNTFNPFRYVDTIKFINPILSVKHAVGASIGEVGENISQAVIGNINSTKDLTTNNMTVDGLGQTTTNANPFNLSTGLSTGLNQSAPL